MKVIHTQSSTRQIPISFIGVSFPICATANRRGKGFSSILICPRQEERNGKAPRASKDQHRPEGDGRALDLDLTYRVVVERAAQSNDAQRVVRQGLIFAWRG
ncbi:hypothetical protein GPA27_12635 [Aromatoleum toluolicum]|uniref:Uncharacterized protein n=1 Tax=Aromatoleum toluolicum TaxID=90060 RepID=A0ABX1NFZ3_9RHOO|nr:hypothetical protein [Aromatoleum toluolicum]NMF98231.1 hypothetical protein [Aromatoleum toluolicum]